MVSANDGRHTPGWGVVEVVVVVMAANGLMREEHIG